MADLQPPTAATQDPIATAKAAYIAGLRKLISMAGEDPGPAVPAVDTRTVPQNTQPAPATGINQTVQAGPGPADRQAAPAQPAPVATPPATPQVVAQGSGAGQEPGKESQGSPVVAGQSDSKLDEAIRQLTTDRLRDVKTAVTSLINSRYAAYTSIAKTAAGDAAKKCNQQKAFNEAILSVVLSLPFFYASDFIGKAVVGVISKGSVQLAKELSMDPDIVSQALKKMLVPTAAQKTVEEAFKEGKKGLSKDFASASSAAEVMAAYTAQIESSLPLLADKLNNRVRDMNDIGTIVTVYSAMLIRTQEVFRAELTDYLHRYETQVAPTYDRLSATSNPDTGGGSTTVRKIAIINIGGKNYRAQVVETVMREPFVSAKPRHSFVCWVELMEDAPDEDAEKIVHVQARDVEGLPSAHPPQTAGA